MSFSSPQVESTTEFSHLPQHDHDQSYNNSNSNNHDQIHVNNIINPHIVIEPIEEHFDWDSIVIILRLALVGTLLVGLSLHETKLDNPNSIPIPPKIFLDTLHIPHIKIADGELSSIWDMTLSISNIMNTSNINILRLDAAVCYKENETLAVETPIMPQYFLQSQVFPLREEDSKKVHLKLNTTGWEKDQPIVDDSVIQSIAQDMQRGVTRFSLHLRVVGEVEYSGDGVAPFIMYPKCSNLKVMFLESNKKGEAATLIDPKPRECLGFVEWGEENSEIEYRN
ncbi:unnamed protein product [Trifolium pratense]|uniref:Uncharacterized protein n=1 Tax=Trifolium pratense TaxID=57577 RepID=A0ACB0IJW6_TRIPR|nr:unnamed protein product [Trifolium pratense]